MNREYRRVKLGENFIRIPPRQAEVLDYMRSFFFENDQLPPAHCIADWFKFSSLNAATEHLKRLEAVGALERNANGKMRFSRSVDWFHWDYGFSMEAV